MLHLLVIGAAGRNNAELFDPRHNDFRWNWDYTAFRPVQLSWTDDASYARYQSGDEDREEE